MKTWLLSQEDSEGAMSAPALSFYHFDPKDGLEAVMKDLYVGDPIQLVEAKGESCRSLGVATVEAIKICTVRFVEPNDLKRGLPRYSSRMEFLRSLREEHPEYKADITPDTQVGVVTVKPLSYDLKGLNQIVGKKPQRVRKVRQS